MTATTESNHMITVNGVELTGDQFDALIRLHKNGWKLDYTSIHKLPAEQCIMVAVKGKETGMQMVMGIEADGYTHS